MKKVLFVCALLAVISPLQAYDVMLLGDVHYDSPDVRVEVAAKRPEYIRNITQWESAIPDMLKKAGIRSADNIDFAVQLGDFIQGDCGSKEKHAQALKTSIQKMSEHIQAPLHVVKGNHDIRGAGGQAAYLDVVFPYMEEKLGMPSAVKGSAHYAVLHKGDLYIYYDSIKPSVKFLEQALSKHANARHVFFLTHLPILPSSFGKQPDWVVYGQRPNRPEERRRVVSLLAKHNAIVLCGHIHRTGIVRYRSDEGTITQVSIFSMSMTPGNRVLTETLLPGSGFFTLPNIQKVSKDEKVKEVMDDFDGKYLGYTAFTPSPDFAVLKVDDAGVSLDLYLDDPEKTVKTLQLVD